jgi:hypothetical protein
MVSRGIVYVDGDEDVEHYEIAVPANWGMHREPRRHGLSKALRYLFHRFPNASRYGWLADDVIPRTYHWDTELENAAGRWRLAYANDGGWLTHEAPEMVWAGETLTTGLCWGGDLVRAVGWLDLPGTVQGGTDMAWVDITKQLELSAYCSGITVEHRHWRAGKRPQDKYDSDVWAENGHSHVKIDRAVWESWRSNGGLTDTAQRIRTAMQKVDAARIYAADH